MNKNLVGGDPYAGDCRIDQFAPWRPLATATGHRTPIKISGTLELLLTLVRGLGADLAFWLPNGSRKRVYFQKFF